MSSAPNSVFKPTQICNLGSVSDIKPVLNPQLNVLRHVGVKNVKTRACCGVGYERNRFYGTRLRGESGQERAHLWQSDGPGKAPKLKVVVVKSSMSQVPEKPLGLYDPSFDKDSCGVGFIAELSGQSSRKTVNNSLVCIYMYVFMEPLFVEIMILR